MQDEQAAKHIEKEWLDNYFTHTEINFIESDLIDKNRKQNNSSICPNYNACHENRSSEVTIFCLCWDFSKGSNNINDIVLKGDYSSDFPYVEEIHANEQEDCHDMMHAHFNIITSSAFQEMDD